MKKIFIFLCLLSANILVAQNLAPVSQAQHSASKIAEEQLRLSGKLVDATNAKSLTPLVAGQDCNTAIPVCQNTYTQSISYTGVGGSNEVSGTCLAGGETNSVWYVFTVQTSGVFTFNINTPNDYDWALYNITNSSCSSIPSSTPIRCNFSSTFGNTGMTTAQGTTAAVSSIGAGGIPFSPALNVVAGQTYVLIVDNFSANSNGYTLAFNAAATGTGGTSTIFDNVNPSLTSVVNNCNNTYTYTFSEPIRCSTIATSAFTVSGGLTVTAATGVDCAGGGTFSRKVLVTTTAPAACGTFNFNVTSALQDACGNSLVPSAAIPKPVLSATIAATRSASAVCAGSGTSVNLTTACTTTGATYAWSNGGDTQTISVAPTATTIYTVTVTADGCSKTASTSVTVNALPIVTVDKLRGVLTPACNPFNATASGPAGTTFVWSPGGATSATLGITAAGTYTVVGTLNGCSAAPISVTVSATPSGCNVLYASAAGGGTGFLPTSPATLTDALILAECLGATVRLQVGTYNTDIPYNIPSNVTLDGGWAAGFGLKTSTTGLTTINRTASGTYPYDGTAAAPALIAMKAISASGFRLQDIKITTANAPAAASVAQKGVSTYALYLSSCSNYTIVRANIAPGNAGNGFSGASGGNASNGGNGTMGGQGDDSCNFSDDIGGSGGSSGGGGSAGTSPIGAAGTSGTGGGNGGAGRDDSNGSQAASGTSACGAGGAGGTSASTGSCGGGNAVNGSACGSAGANGTDGTSGIAAYTGGYFTPNDGTNGTRGTGAGGGGGGGGGGRNTSGACSGSGNGGSGGGGGGGGGGGAQLGTGAGGAFGLFAWSNGSGGVLTDCELVTPTAGTAGAGGTGGTGGTAGAGGAARTTCGPNNGQVHRGGAGGNGAAGGRGGNGGNGSAGSAFRLVNLGSTLTVNGSSYGAGSSVNPTSFALSTQTEIYWDGKACTNVPSSLTALSGATGFSSAGGTYANPNMTWTATGRKDVVLGANTYTGFVDIITSAPAVDYTADVPFNVADNVFRVCEGGSLTFTSTLPLDNSITNFKWDFDTASGVTDVNSATANTTTVTFNTPGASYTLIHNVTTACCGPVNDKVYIIKVEPKPTPVATIAQTICKGNSATLNITTPTATSNYMWSTAAAGNSITVSPTATTAYTVEETTQYGCKRVSAPVNITVLNIPMPAAATGTRLLCEGQSVNLALTATNATNFNWTCTQCAVTSGSGTPITSAAINTAGDYDYIITPRNVSGGTSCPTTPLNVKVIVEAIPTVTAVTDMCVGTNVIITGGARDYRLFDMASAQISPSGSGYAPSVSASIVDGSNNFYLQGKSAAGCVSTQVPISVQGHNLPIVNPTAAVVCGSGSVTIANTATNTGTLTYAVSSITPAGTLPASNATGAFTLPAGSTAATFQITSQFGCPSTARAIAFGCTLPIKLISFAGRINGNTNELLWATASELNTKWHIIERSADGINDFVAIGRVAAAGNSTTKRDYKLLDKTPYTQSYYRLRTLDNDGSESLSNVITLIQKRNTVGLVSAYPNPAQTELNVSIASDAVSDVTIALVDVLGRVISKEKITLGIGTNTHVLNLSALPNALYLLQIDNGALRNTLKVVKQAP